MQVYFKGTQVFPGAIVRQAASPRGLETLDRSRLAPPAGGTALLGTLERHVVLRGRLVGESVGNLAEQIDAALAVGGEPPAKGELVVGGRSIGELYLLRVGIVGTVDRGRIYSAAFEAAFGDITVLEKE